MIIVTVDLKKYKILIEINSSGVINININFKSQTNKQELEELLDYYLNTIILRKIENLNNYDINNFESLDSTNIEIININYYINYKLSNKVEDFNKIKKCLNYIFATENEKNSNLKKFYKYKKVSYYDDTNAINSFIIDNIKLNVKPNKIIELIKENFDIKSDNECKEIFKSIIETLNFSKNLNNNLKLKIKNNTGFKTNIEINNNNININISDINNINYELLF